MIVIVVPKNKNKFTVFANEDGEFYNNTGSVELISSMDNETYMVNCTFQTPDALYNASGNDVRVFALASFTTDIHDILNDENIMDIIKTLFLEQLKKEQKKRKVSYDIVLN